MPPDRLLGSYLLRVTVRDGSRSIILHNVASGASHRFDTFVALAEHLHRSTGTGRDETRAAEGGGGAGARPRDQ